MIELQQINIQRNVFRLKGINLKVPQASYASLVGPSGSGKTTILECIAGLLRPSSGRIHLQGVDSTSVVPANRNIGYVPQDLALFSSMTVRQNLAFGLRKQKVSRATSSDRVAEMADCLQLAHALKERAAHLSRGQAQRVALGRALVMRPRILIMDEPLNALDAATRKLVIKTLANFHAEHRPTVLHVTHQQSDITELCDMHVELKAGSIVYHAQSQLPTVDGLKSI